MDEGRSRVCEVPGSRRRDPERNENIMKRIVPYLTVLAALFAVGMFTGTAMAMPEFDSSPAYQSAFPVARPLPAAYTLTLVFDVALGDLIDELYTGRDETSPYVGVHFTHLGLNGGPFAVPGMAAFWYRPLWDPLLAMPAVIPIADSNFAAQWNACHVVQDALIQLKASFAGGAIAGQPIWIVLNVDPGAAMAGLRGFYHGGGATAAPTQIHANEFYKFQIAF